MNTVAVISNTGEKLMPTTSYRARRLIKSGKAVAYKYRPVFTIQLIERETGEVQPIEYACDTGYQHIGISIKSATKEYVNRQYDLLLNEPEKHNDRLKYRRTRRNRLRYRAARWNNRKSSMICKDGFAPSIRNKRDRHIDLCKSFCEIMPITDIIFEMGQFDTQVLKAIEEGKPIPEGTDYQQGEQYGYATLREAVFNRDNYTCIVCGKSALKNGAILKIHHLGYLQNDRTNRMNNLATVCSCCHTSKNHKQGGKLYGLKPKFKNFKGATFMTSVRWSMLDSLRESFPEIPVHVTYGAYTKMARKTLNVKKDHSNDAYCMGNLHPKHRTDWEHLKKCRRNSRVLSKFYDAKYIDKRDGSTKSGSQLSCGRTNRSVSRHTDSDERQYRLCKVSKGKFAIRRRHYQYRPGDTVWIENKKYKVKTIQSNGKTVNVFERSFSVNKIQKCVHTGAFTFVV